LAHCDFFRNNYGGKVWGIAGMFDSGTNLAANYLESNCILPSTSTDKDSFDILWEVPWGKRVPAEMRNHKSYRRNDKSKDDATSSVMPIVMIRDPYFRMQSMCHHNYGARWFHSTDHCPNLVPNKWDTSYRAGPNPGTIPVRIKYDFGWREWDSLAHLWTNWYQQYHKEADYPRILVRYEDMIFYPKEVTRQLCEVCAGGTLRKDFSYQVDSAKQGPGHGDVRTSWITAIIRYGSDRWRLRGALPTRIYCWLGKHWILQSCKLFPINSLLLVLVLLLRLVEDLLDNLEMSLLHCHTCAWSVFAWYG
jgi:hypothetical protein